MDYLFYAVKVKKQYVGNSWMYHNMLSDILGLF